MADDSENIKEIFEFHPHDTPRGMLYYNLSELTSEQQKLLNDQKLDVIRENQQYLSAHPEIKAVTTMILKAILRERPKVNVQEFLAKYLIQSWPDIKKEIDKCVAERERKAHLHRVMPSSTSIIKGEEGDEQVDESTELEAEHDTQMMCRNILDELIDNLSPEDKDNPNIVQYNFNKVDEYSPLECMYTNQNSFPELMHDEENECN